MGSNEARDLFQAQTHLYKHIFNFASSMSLKCAVQLGIPDVIDRHGEPISLPELVTALQLHPDKTGYVQRLMRLMVHSGFFATIHVCRNQDEEEEEAYDLTTSSRLLLKDKVPSMLPFVTAMLDPALTTPWQFLGNWFCGNEVTPFETAHGMGLWEYGHKNPGFNRVFNEAMASDSGMMNLVIKDCKPNFEGLSSLVDVGGGTGKVARILCEAFPNLKCTVLELPQVVANLQDSANLKFIAGDMFHAIPPADAILLKLTLHALSDEECLKVLKKCREAIPDNGKGKVIIIDIVINEEGDEHESTEAKLFFDMLMMVVVTGRERREKEWEKLILEAGFSKYQITPIFGLRSLIEVYP
ncbi:PREDICTED: trans-resveratrol di-O-methyltransferase-like [Fragaria vesca subsp. vesca]|uniref:trans-resveratrol di-O-methyltransferase-like n=1 Tax=Fragaria vesca subsp. vesca TaxID=101020 RepID=UPI0002C348AB|nr:PREDICTED: trans-resveratrol di-O-methyltransferase-like [Fragaria vesca subsp. vesca]